MHKGSSRGLDHAWEGWKGRFATEWDCCLTESFHAFSHHAPVAVVQLKRSLVKRHDASRCEDKGAGHSRRHSIYLGIEQIHQLIQRFFGWDETNFECT